MTLTSGRRFALWVAVTAVLFLAGFLLGRSGRETVPHSSSMEQDHVGHEHVDVGQGDRQGEDVVWTCSMHPQIQLPEAGKCPICFMDLIPVTQGDGGGEERISLRQIELSERARELARVQTAEVVRSESGGQVRIIGRVEFDETGVASISARMPGRIDELFVTYTGERVRRGQPMARLYSPELFAAQAELIQAEKALRESSSPRLVTRTAEQVARAAREKLRLLGVSAAQIEAIARQDAPRDHVTIHAPQSGIVTMKEVNTGEYVTTGSRLFAIADLSTVWVILDAYESDMPFLTQGATVRFTAEAAPGKVFTGKVAFVDPFLNEATRTIRVRVEVPNPDLALRPGMFVRAEILNSAKASGGEGELLIPSGAPLVTGKRAVVYVEIPGRTGAYEGREVVLGPKTGGMYVVREGLREGERVVTRGAFQIDSALQIQARPSMMSPDSSGAGGARVDGHAHHGDGGTMHSAAQTPFEAPFVFTSRLETLFADNAAVQAAAEERDLAALNKAFQAFYDRICAVDPTPITDRDTALEWRELSMVMKNDALIGAESNDLGEALFSASSLQQSMDRLRVGFGLGEDGSPAARYPAPREFTIQLGQVVAASLPLSEALSRDDPDGAKAAAEGTGTALDAADADLLEGEGREVWRRESQVMRDAVAAMRRAEDLAALRTSFSTFSAALIRAVDDFGRSGTEQVYVAFCPMAFDNSGAEWVQTGTEIRNPYFGAMMFSCGEIRRAL